MIQLLNSIATNPAPLAASLDYGEIIRHSGPVGIGVLLLLLGASAASWAIIGIKFFQLKRAREESIEFLDAFWQSKRLDAIFQRAEELKSSPVSQVFRAGYIELSKVTSLEGGDPTEGGLDNVRRALSRAVGTETTHLESKVAFLATTSTTAPFVGLFGTVWGIMAAFQDIYLQGNANLSTVSKPISEALIATAVGLFAAIPAAVAYNFFVSKIKVLESEMESFSADFLNIVKRHFFK